MPRVLVGGVGYRWQRDLSFGLIVADALAEEALPAGVEIRDLGYGALYVAMDLEDAQPRYDRLILLAGVARDRPPGRLYRSRWDATPADPEEVQARIYEAGAGVIDLDHLLVIARHFDALPPEVILIEAEPVEGDGGDGLSAAVAALLPAALVLVRQEALAPRRTLEGAAS